VSEPTKAAVAAVVAPAVPVSIREARVKMEDPIRARKILPVYFLLVSMLEG
jgi:hypothetical protein